MNNTFVAPVIEVKEFSVVDILLTSKKGDGIELPDHEW